MFLCSRDQFVVKAMKGGHFLQSDDQRNLRKTGGQTGDDELHGASAHKSRTVSPSSDPDQLEPLYLQPMDPLKHTGINFLFFYHNSHLLSVSCL